MIKPYVIVLSQFEADVIFGQHLATQCGFQFLRAASVPDLERYLIDRSNSLVFIDVDSKESQSALHQVAAVLRLYSNPRFVFGIATKPIFDLVESNRFGVFGHYYVRNYDSFAMNWMPRLCRPIFSPESFGVDFYKDSDASVHKIELKSSRERGVLIQVLDKYLVEKGVNDRAAQMSLRAVDEVLMNAIFDAPIDSGGVRYRINTPREEYFELKDKERVFVTVVRNLEFMLVAVRDQFGSLELKAATDAAKANYRVKSYDSNAHAHAGRIGLQAIAASGTSYLANCKPKAYTEVVLAFPYFRSFKETKSVFRSFSFNIQDSSIKI
ncbi:MAG: hypothetical protein EOP09_17320 [Proteobacteria bacterium]|nr:MAG: hypothetical protein EOP09_17320 [Pseudomonadota bacterium]